MGNSLLECRVFGRRAGRAAAERAKRMSTSRSPTDLQGAVEDAAAHLYVWALKDIPQDLRDALAAAREPRDVGHRASACSQTILRNVDVAEDEKNLVCQDTGHRRLLLPGRRALPAPPGADLRGAQDGHRARDGRAPAPLEHRPHAHAREHRAERRLPRADRALGLRPRLGRPRRQVRPQGLGLREHELPQDVRPRRRRDGDQEVRARVDRRRRRQAVPAGDRRRRHRRLRRLRDAPREGGDRASGRDAQPGSARRPARGRAVRAPQRDGHRADGARRRRDRALRPRRARGHAHDAQSRRGQLPVLGRAPRLGARRRGRRREYERDA